MGRRINYDMARATLAQAFEEAQRDFQGGTPVAVSERIAVATATLFASRTQAFREALTGCALARILDATVNIRLPYVKQSDDAFSGRQLDQNVVNPFFRDRAIPCSTGPYLSTIRRNFRFVPEAADRGIRDTEAFASFLDFISVLEAEGQDEARIYLRYLLYWFLDLRNRADVRVTPVHRFSLEQFGILTEHLLSQPSGGLMPVLLATATFETIKQTFGLPWEINWQGINVADRAAGVGGDISILREGELIMAVEVTEREIDRNRVIATFAAKIVPANIRDYIFLFSDVEPAGEAKEAARAFFAQGYDLNFMPVKEWIHFILGTLGPAARESFAVNLLELLQSNRVPAALRVTWNEQVAVILSPSTQN